MDMGDKICLILILKFSVKFQDLQVQQYVCECKAMFFVLKQKQYWGYFLKLVLLCFFQVHFICQLGVIANNIGNLKFWLDWVFQKFHVGVCLLVFFQSIILKLKFVVFVYVM
eukprot:TRINITY_DN16119_c0_g1_i2.p5 TRINITY_DN16119_c0_g1~~TRINITY_DN16119_c0_g1_i2.p5  ORF type:complete len:112 (-),score=3.91 TRINITY_DN16119_c0_g1_i2:103-438(-)